MTEENYIERDAFIIYIQDKVNPARLKSGLEEIREYEARECFRILKDFSKSWNHQTGNEEWNNYYISYQYVTKNGNVKTSYGYHQTTGEHPDLDYFCEDIKSKKDADFIVILSCIQVEDFPAEETTKE